MIIDTTQTKMERKIWVLEGPCFFDSHTHPGPMWDWNLTEFKPDKHMLQCNKIIDALRDLGNLSVEDRLGVIEEVQYCLQMEQATAENDE